LNAINTGCEKKTSQYCAVQLENAIAQAEAQYEVEVVGVVTDNCNSMILMHDIIREKIPGIIAYGCNSHLLNLLGDHFTPKDLISKLVKVQKYIRCHTFTAAKLTAVGGLRPVLPGSTRWNSQIDCCKNFISNHGKYLDVIRQSMENAKNKQDSEKELEVYAYLRDNTVYDRVNDTIKVLEPISFSLDRVRNMTRVQ